MKTIDISQHLEKHLQDLVYHSVSLEHDNAMLKRVIRILANSMALDEQGNQTMQLSQEDADFVKRICDEANVFMAYEKW